MNDNPFEPASNATPEQPVQPAQQPINEPSPILGQQPIASESAPIIGGAGNQQQAPVVDAMHAVNVPHQKKKWLVPAIIGVLLAAAAAVVLVIVLNNGGGNGGGNNGGDQRGSGVAKKQEFLNDQKADSSKLAYIIDGGGSVYKDVLVGVNYDGVAKDLRITHDGLVNSEDYGVAEAHFEDFWVYAKDGSILFNTDREYGYAKEEGGKKYFINREIVHEDGDYFVAHLSDLFVTYYRYDFGDSRSSVRALKLDIAHSLEEAKSVIERLKPILSFCAFTKDEGVEKCSDYKSYNYVEDIVMEDLNRWGLYLSSYKEVKTPYASSHTVTVEEQQKEGDHSSPLSFTIGVTDDKISDKTKSEYQEFQMNGKTFYYKNGAVVTEMDGNTMGISISLAYGMDKTDENYLSEFKRFFSNEQ